MRKIIIVLALATAAFFYYEKVYNIEGINNNDNRDYEKIIIEDEEVVVIPPQIDFNKDTRRFDSQTEVLNCKDNEAICAVDLAVKCTINPKLNFCNKNKLPRFIFMDEEALGRPTKIDYKIVKIHPIDMNTAEIRTKSECDGMWFGLCNGNIIYVVNKSSGEWVVKEIYALETY